MMDMTGHVDELLEALECEQECLAELRRDLQPAMTRLLVALGVFLASGRGVGARAEVDYWRGEVERRKAGAASLLRRWEAARGSEEACWAALSAMTPAQIRRFDDLASAARVTAEGDAEFARLRERTGRLLLLFEGVTA